MLKCTSHAVPDCRWHSLMEVFKSMWIIMGNLQRWRLKLVKASFDNNMTLEKHKDHGLSANEEECMSSNTHTHTVGWKPWQMRGWKWYKYKEEKYLDKISTWTLPFLQLKTQRKRIALVSVRKFDTLMVFHTKHNEASIQANNREAEQKQNRYHSWYKNNAPLSPWTASVSFNVYLIIAQSLRNTESVLMCKWNLQSGCSSSLWMAPQESIVSILFYSKCHMRLVWKRLWKHISYTNHILLNPEEKINPLLLVWGRSKTSKCQKWLAQKSVVHCTRKAENEMEIV